jgi:hypothetical protein
MAASRRGAALFITFILVLMLAGLALAVGAFSHNSLLTGRSQLLDKQAYYIALAGWQRARQALVAGTWVAAALPGSTNTEPFGAGEYVVTIVDHGDGTYSITSDGYVPSQSAPQAQRRVQEGQDEDEAVSVTITTGSNFSLTAPAAVSSGDASGNPASNAKDGNTGTRWEASTNGSNTWLGMDLGSATTVDRIVVKEQNERINDLRIEFSDDGSAWTTVSGQSVVESGDDWIATFPETSHRYFRAFFFDVDPTKPVRVRELETYNSSVSSLGSAPTTTSR